MACGIEKSEGLRDPEMLGIQNEQEKEKNVKLTQMIKFMRLGGLLFVFLCCAALAILENSHAGSHFGDLCLAFGTVLLTVTPLFALTRLFRSLHNLDEAMLRRSSS